MSDQCSICRDPMTDDTCQTCGARLCPRHRYGNHFEPRMLQCHPCYVAHLEMLHQLPTPSRAEALAALVERLLKTGAHHGYTPDQMVGKALWGQGSSSTPGGLSYSYGSTVTYCNRKHVSLPKDSVVVEKVHGTPCFEVFRYADLDQAVRDRIEPPPPIPVQLEMFA